MSRHELVLGLKLAKHQSCGQKTIAPQKSMHTQPPHYGKFDHFFWPNLIARERRTILRYIHIFYDTENCGRSTAPYIFCTL